MAPTLSGTTPRAISQRLCIREREVYVHLPHILRSVEEAGKKLVVIGLECLSCGFKFEGRKKEMEKISKPGRCPKCRAERITTPRFAILG
ncbi:MAG: transcriptional regulator [Desulfosalsimonadaceae bacterium]